MRALPSGPAKSHRPDHRAQTSLGAPEEAVGAHGHDRNNGVLQPPAVIEELETARRICRDGGFCVVDVTDKSVEIIADEIIKFITQDQSTEQRGP